MPIGNLAVARRGMQETRLLFLRHAKDGVSRFFNIPFGDWQGRESRWKKPTPFAQVPTAPDAIDGTLCRSFQVVFGAFLTEYLLNCKVDRSLDVSHLPYGMMIPLLDRIVTRGFPAGHI